VTVGPDGVVWIGTRDGGVSRFDGKTWTTYTIHDGLPDNDVGPLPSGLREPYGLAPSGGVSRYVPVE
jgi:hypothetical protein